MAGFGINERPHRGGSRVPHASWVVAVAALAAGAIGYLSVAGLHGSRSAQAQAVADTPQFQLWAALATAQFFFWALGFAYLARRLADSTDLAAVRRREWVVIIAVLAGLVVPIGLTYDRSDVIESPIRWHEWRIMLQIVIGVAATSPGIIILERVRESALALLDDVRPTRPEKDRLQLARKLHALADIVIIVLSGLIALTVLSTAALQGALEEAATRRGDDPPNQFIVEFVVLFGLQLSGILAALALRAGGPLRRLRSELVDELLPEPTLDAADWAQMHAQRTALRESLHPRDESSIGATFAVLVPLGSALISAML